MFCCRITGFSDSAFYPAIITVGGLASTVIVHLIARADTGAIDTAFAPAAGHTGTGIGNNALIIAITFFAAAAVTVCHTLHAFSGRFVTNAGRFGTFNSFVAASSRYAIAANFSFAVWTLAASADTGLAAGADVWVIAAGFGSAAAAVRNITIVAAH